MLRSLCEDYPFLTDEIQLAAATEYRLTVEDIPSPEEKKGKVFMSKLCRDICAFNVDVVVASQEFGEDEWDGSPSHGDGTVQSGDDVPTHIAEWFLGDVGQETLTQVISRDELDPRRKRVPWLTHGPDWPRKPPFPADVLLVGKWIRNKFGRRHPVTATFMNHAVVNGNFEILRHYLSDSPMVPVTLHHFKMLARLGHATQYLLYHAIKSGAGFYFSDNDYLRLSEIEVKRETPCAETVGVIKDPPPSVDPSSSPAALLSAVPTRKRPHRSAAATVKSYAYTQSDSDEEIPIHGSPMSSRWVRTIESDLQLWIKHLSALHKDETKKFNEKKRRLEQSNRSGPRPRVVRNEFLRTLATGLRELRQLELAKRQQVYVPAVPDDRSASDDDEYQCPRPSRRRKMTS